MIKYPSGIYHQKLKATFTVLAIIITLLLASVSGFYMIQISENNYMNSIKLSSNILEERGTLVLKNISNIMTNIVNDPLIQEWSVSQGKKDFYLLSSKVQQQLKKHLADSQSRFQIYLLLDEENVDYTSTIPSTILSSQSSFSTSKFLEDKHLSEDDLSTIREYFNENMVPYVTPHYNDSGVLDSVQYWIKGYQSIRNCIYMADIPITSILGSSVPENYWISDSRTLFIPSTPDKNTSDMLRSLHQETDTDLTLTKSSEYYITTAHLSGINWNISYLYEKHSLNVMGIFLFLALFVLLFLFLFFVSSRIAEHLYLPIYRILQPALEEKVENFDEFKILHNTLNRLQDLNENLIETQEFTNSLLAQQYYQNLLTDPDGYLAEKTPPYFPDDGNFCVGLIHFSLDTNESERFIDDFHFRQLELYKNLFFQECVHLKNIVFVRLSIYRCGLVINSENIEEAKHIVSQIFSKISGSKEISRSWEEQIILSPVQNGFENIHQCYLKALKIAEYLPALPHEKIITYEQIAGIDSTTYSYPLSTELKLIQEVINGNNKALNLFDELIRENLVNKVLSMDILQNFIYTLIGTINRIFQELKVPPEEFIGRSIHYEYWYTHWADSTTITEIKSVLSDIICKQNQRSQHQDKVLLSQMLDYIHENYKDNIMLNDLAAQFNISPKYCGILFKQLSDNNFKDYLNNYRIEQAKKFIAENPSLKTKDLSLMTGFNSSNTFIRVFSKYTGFTPQKYAEHIIESSNRVEGE